MAAARINSTNRMTNRGPTPIPAPIPSTLIRWSWRRVMIVCGLAVFAFSLALYVWTLAPTVTLVDSGELIVAARTLGVAHPPGFPLYILLAHLASIVPLGSVAARVNFASAIFAALASTAVTLLMLELIRTGGRGGGGSAGSKGGKRKPAASAGLKSDPVRPDWVGCTPRAACRPPVLRFTHALGLCNRRGSLYAQLVADRPDPVFHGALAAPGSSRARTGHCSGR